MKEGTAATVALTSTKVTPGGSEPHILKGARLSRTLRNSRQWVPQGDKSSRQPLLLS